MGRVGYLGTGSSGKSSLIRIVRQELLTIRDAAESRSRYLSVEFSPCQYEVCFRRSGERAFRAKEG